MKKPDLTVFQDIKTELLNLRAKAHQNWVEMELLYDQKHSFRTGNWLKRKLAVARSIIDGAVDNMVSLKPKITRHRAEGEVHQKRADNVEKWAQAAIRHFNLDELQPPFKAMSKFMFLLGYTGTCLEWSDTAYEEGRFPFRLQVPHPGRLLLPPFERDPSVAIILSTVTTSEIAKRYPGFKQLKPLSFAQCERFYSEDWHGLLVNGETVFFRKNSFHFVPCAHSFAGYGMEHSSSNFSDDGQGVRFEDMAVGLLAFVKDSLISLDEWKSAMDHLNLRIADKKLFYSGDVNELAESIKQVGLTGVVHLPRNQQLKWEETPNIESWQFEVAQMSMQDVFQGTYAGEVRGFRSPGVTTATQHGLMLGTARMKFDTPILQLNRMAAQILGFAARMIVEQSISLEIDGIKCSPDDFENDFTFEVDFTSPDEGQLLRKSESGRNLFLQGIISLETCLREYQGIEDVTGEIRRIMTGNLMRSPSVQQAVIAAGVSGFQEWAQKEGVELPPQSPVAAGQAAPQPLVVQPETMNQVRQATGNMQQTMEPERVY